ncbi:MAG: hypothetical protein IT317_06400 [Anaerolineales bacterium]|nr:hypothetical protein [Anaerolineales bacterium]
MKPTASNLIRWAGLSAVAAGVSFIVVQIIHPIDVLASVTTPGWTTVHYLSFSMCVFGLFGLVGIYARQAEKAGWLGLTGYLLFSVFYMVTGAFQFIEALVSPVLAIEAPRYVEGFLGMVTGHAGEISMGALPTVNSVNGLLYMLGSLALGIATFRARVLPRWAAMLLAVSGPLAAAMTTLLSHPLDRLAAVPMGVALVGLGLAVWANRREPAAQTAATSASPTLRQAGAR